MQVGRLEIELLANVARLSRDMERARGVTGGAMDQIERRVQMMARTVAASAAAAGAAMLAWTNSIARAGSEINRLSQVSGTTATEFQRYAYAARTAGIEQGKLADIFKDMQDRVGDFLQTGGGPLADFFENIAPKVGVTIEQFRTLSGPQALGLFVQSLEKANLSQSEMTFYMEAIASDSTMLLPLLKNNSAALKTLGDEAERVGAIMNDQTVQAAVQMEQNLERLQSMVSSLSISIANQFLPTLNAFIENVIKAATETDGLQTEVNDLAKNESLKTFLNDALVGLARVADVAVFAAKSVGVVGSAFVAAKADIEGFLAFVGRPDALSKAIAPEESARLEAEYQAAQQARIDATETFNKRLDDLLTYQGNRFEQAALQAINTIQVQSDAIVTVDLTAQKAAGSVEKLGKATVAAGKAAQQFEQERQRHIRSQYQEISNLADQADALEDQVRYYGLSESALNDLTIARLEEQKAALMGIEGAEEEIAIRQRMIEQYQRMGVAMRSIEAKEAEKAAWQQWSRDVEGIFQQVSQSLTDAIFEGGKSGRDLVKDLFKTLTLRVLINPVMNSIQGAVTNSLGGVFGFNNPQQGAGGGLMNGLSNIGTMLSGNSFGAGISQTAYNLFSTPVSAAAGGVGPAAPSAISGLFSNAGAYSNLAYGATGLLGGLGANLLFGGKGQSSTGGSLGATAGLAIGGPIGALVGGLAGGALGSLFGDDEPKTRHGQWEWAEMSGDNWGMKFRDSRQPAGTGDAIVNYARSAVDSANATFGKLGVNAAIEYFYATTNSSIKGDRNGVASGGTLIVDNAQATEFGLMGLGGDRTKYGFGGWSKEEMLPRLQTDIQLSILEAFQTQVDSLPKVLADMIGGVNIRALDAAGANALAEQFNAIITGVDMFREAAKALPFEQLSDLSFDAAASLIQFAGGLDSLNAGLTTYYENFYTEAERLEITSNNIAKALGEVGLEIPDTRESFRALVEAQDLTTESGQRAYAALLEVSGAFAQVADASERAAQEAIAQAQATAQARLSLQNQIDAALGNTAALRDRELAAMDASLRPMQEYLWAVQDAQAAAERQYQSDMRTYQQQLAHWQGLQNAVTEAFSEVRRIATEEMNKLKEAARQTDTAMGALRERVNAQTSLLNRFISGLEGIYSSIRDVFDYLDEQIRDLRGQSAGGMQAREGWKIIGEAISSGIIPDAEKLQQAVGAVRAEMDSTHYASAFERDRASMLLASRLEQIQGVAEPQMSFAQQQIEIAKQQLKALKDSLIEAQNAVNESRGIKENTGDLGPAGDQVEKMSDVWKESKTQVLALADIVGNTSVTDQLFDEVLDAVTYEQWAEAKIDGINAQLGLAQKQYDEFRGLNSKATTMIQALNNMASALNAAAVAQPTQPTPTQPGTVTPPPAPTIPDYFRSAAETSGYSASQIKNKRLYLPRNDAEALDYLYGKGNTDIFVAFLNEVSAGNFANTPADRLRYAQLHWNTYGRLEGNARAYADGGYYPGGMALVGEEGPELINFKQPGMVYTAAQTANLMRGDSDSRELVSEIKALRAENKAHAQALVSLQAQTTRILRQWDATGTPETRELVEA